MKLRESTADYLFDPGLANAVNDLVENARVTSNGMDWSSYPELVAAWLAAQQVVAEFALSLNECWEATWGARDLAGFSALDFSFSVETDEAWNDPVSTWTEWWTGRYFSVSRTTKAWLGVGFEERRLRLGVFPVRRSKLLKLDLGGFEYDAEMSTYVSGASALIARDGSVDLVDVSSLADQALQVLRESA